MENYLKSIIVFNTLINTDEKISIDCLNIPLFKKLLEEEYISISDDFFIIKKRGLIEFNIFMKKYNEYLEYFSKFIIDLSNGEIAYKNYNNFKDKKEWNRYLNQIRFKDLSLTVALHKGIDTSEIIFMSFLDKVFKNKNWQQYIIDNNFFDYINLLKQDITKPEDIEGLPLLITNISEVLVKNLEIEKEKKYREQLFVDSGIDYDYLIDEIDRKIDYYSNYCYFSKYKEKIWKERDFYKF